MFFFRCFLFRDDSKRWIGGIFVFFYVNLKVIEDVNLRDYSLYHIPLARWDWRVIGNILLLCPHYFIQNKRTHQCSSGLQSELLPYHSHSFVLPSNVHCDLLAFHHCWFLRRRTMTTIAAWWTADGTEEDSRWGKAFTEMDLYKGSLLEPNLFFCLLNGIKYVFDISK